MTNHSEVPMHSTRAFLMPSALAAVLFASAIGTAAPDDSPAPLRPETLIGASSSPSLASPAKLGVRLTSPQWTAEGLWPSAPASLPALASAERKGSPVHDPSSGAWFASVNGAIVRVDGSRLIVTADNVQGTDIDVRASQAVAVSREPNDTIVLHRFGSRTERRVLMTGQQYFHPRLSPDGTRLIVSESRTGGGHVWLVPLEGAPTDLGVGQHAAWHPDGWRVVFARVGHDGYQITSSELFAIDLATRVETRLTQSAGIAEVTPVVSPDGRWIAFADARNGDGWFAAMPLTGGR